MFVFMSWFGFGFWFWIFWICAHVSNLVLMLKSGFVFLDLCSCVSDLVLMFKPGFVFLSLYSCVWVGFMNAFCIGFGLVLLKEIRFYRFVFLYFRACCVYIMGCVPVFNFSGFVFFYIYIYIYILFCLFCFLFCIS